MELSVFSYIFLTIIVLAALFLPFLWHKAEEQLEIFLFCLGVLAATASHCWSWQLVKEAITHPITITLAVLITGILFNHFKDKITMFIESVASKFGLKKTIFFAVLSQKIYKTTHLAMIGTSS